MLTLVDDREPPEVAQTVEAQISEAIVVTKRLKLGDIRMGPLTVERKTAQDFINSWFSGHLMMQVSELVKSAGRPVLAVHLANEHLDQEQYRVLRDRLSTINLALPTYLFSSLDEMVNWLADHLKYAKSGEWVQYVKRPVRVREPTAEPVAAVYAGLPHVSTERAQALAEAYPNPKLLSDAISTTANRQRGTPPWYETVQGVGRRIGTCIEEVWLRGRHVPHQAEQEVEVRAQ